MITPAAITQQIDDISLLFKTLNTEQLDELKNQLSKYYYDSLAIQSETVRNNTYMAAGTAIGAVSLGMFGALLGAKTGSYMDQRSAENTTVSLDKARNVVVEFMDSPCKTVNIEPEELINKQEITAFKALVYFIDDNQHKLKAIEQGKAKQSITSKLADYIDEVFDDEDANVIREKLHIKSRKDLIAEELECQSPLKRVP